MNENESPAARRQGAPFAVVIPSARAQNLVPCVRAILAHEPELPPDRIVVVDDGARADAEGQLPGVRWIPGIKPFVYARNVNLGIRAADTDVILLNDDALLVTPRGFTQLAEQVRGRPHVGVCSAGILGVVGNESQTATGRREFRDGESAVPFACVYLPKWVYQRVGPLDERFTGYGYEDIDYCTRVRKKGFMVGIWDGCALEHPGDLVRSYQNRADFSSLLRESEALFIEKWGRKDPFGPGPNPFRSGPGPTLGHRLKSLINGEAFGLKLQGPDEPNRARRE